MRAMCTREIFTKKCLQQQIFDSDLKGAWHYNHVTFTPIAKNFTLYCRLIYMLSILCVTLTIKVKVGIPESFKVGGYSSQKTGSSHLKLSYYWGCSFFSILISTSFRWHVVIRTSFIVFVYIQVWCIPFHYRLHFFDQTVETGANVRVFVPTVSNQLISVMNGEKK